MPSPDFLEEDDDKVELPEKDEDSEVDEVPEVEQNPPETSDEIPKKEMEFIDEDPDDDEDESPRRMRRSRKSKEPKDPITQKAKQETAEELDEIINELSPGRSKNIFLTITRAEPKIYKGKRIEGFLQRIEGSITEDEIKELYGGGIYDVKFFGPKGYRAGVPWGNQILRSKRIRISGDPIINDEKKTSLGEEPSIVHMALKAQQDLLSKKQEDQDGVAKQNEKLLTMLVSGGKTDTGMVQLIQGVIESIKTSTDSQMKLMNEQLKLMREEMNRKEERYQDQIRRSEEKSEKATVPMLDYLTKQQSESNTKSEMMLKNMTEMFKIQLQAAQDASKNQIEMIQASHKMQSEMLMTELKRQSDELKDARISGKTDLLSEMKKLASIKNLMSDISGSDAAAENGLAEKLIDKIPEIAESVPSIIGALGGLFGGGQKTQVVRRTIPTQQRPALPPSPPSPKPVQSPVQPKPPAQEILNENEQQKIAMMIATIVQNIETAIEGNKTPEQFINEYIIGKFDESVLKKVVSVPPGAILGFIEQNIDVGDDNIITTTQGRDFIRNCLTELKKKVQ